jgi:sRNA-binding protein
MKNRAMYERNAAVPALLAERWPACFAIYEQRRRPLKVGIHRDILAALDGAVTAKGLGAAFCPYCTEPFMTNRKHAKGCRRAACRYNRQKQKLEEGWHAYPTRSGS